MLVYVLSMKTMGLYSTQKHEEKEKTAIRKEAKELAELNAEKLLKTEAYDFLREDPRLKDIVLLGLGGSHAYGTNIESSDVDVRGIAMDKEDDILLGKTFEQVVDKATDTTIYSFRKIITLLSDCNPNTIEMLGLKPEHYLITTPVGQTLIDNRQWFLSQKCVKAFGGYAAQQLYRMRHLAAQDFDKEELERHIMRTLQSISEHFPQKYTPFDKEGLKFFIDTSAKEDMDTEIFVDIFLPNYPIRDLCMMLSELNQTIKSYNKVGKRNENASKHQKLGKHMMHLFRLYRMAVDIMEKGEIITYREKEREEFLAIRNGLFLTEDDKIRPGFEDALREEERRFAEAKKHTLLPQEPDYKAINEFVRDVHRDIIITGE